jgi:hypothetical protein
MHSFTLPAHASLKVSTGRLINDCQPALGYDGARSNKFKPLVRKSTNNFLKHPRTKQIGLCFSANAVARTMLQRWGSDDASPSPICASLCQQRCLRCAHERKRSDVSAYRQTADRATGHYKNAGEQRSGDKRHGHSRSRGVGWYLPINNTQSKQQSFVSVIPIALLRFALKYLIITEHKTMHAHFTDTATVKGVKNAEQQKGRRYQARLCFHG